MKTSALGAFVSVFCLSSIVLCTSPASLAQSFVATGSMETVRYGHSETSLNNLGMILVAGGENQLTGSILSSAELYNPATGLFKPTGSLVAARYWHTATLLNNGMVLIAGGTNGVYPAALALATAELYNPATGTFTQTGSMHTARANHTATLLPNGMVLVAGGGTGKIYSSPRTATAELYNPATGTFTTTGSLNTAREEGTATLLTSGEVLFVAGLGNSTQLATAELYNPATGKFTLTGSLPGGVQSQSAALLYNGQVLVAAGSAWGGVTASAYLYNPSTGKFAATGSMHQARYGQTAALLNNGQILVAGGSYNGSLSSAEIYDPPSGTFITTGNLNIARAGAQSALLDNGYVLVTGGASSTADLQSAELYQFVNDSPPETGFIDPKYVVVAVTYAPPGSKSNVNYSESTMVGTSTSISNAFTSGVSESVSVGGGANIFGTGNNVTGTADSSYSQEEDTSSSVTVSRTASRGMMAPGPLSSAAGVDHDYDQVWVWLNPKINLGLTYNVGVSTPSALLWGGYSYDNRDPAHEMEVVPLYVTWLKNPSTIPSPYPAAYLERSWDTSGLGGLNSADYAAILARDPFVANPAYNPNYDPATRFDLQGGEDFAYQPPPPGGQPDTETYTLTTVQTTTAGQGASDTYSVGFSLDAQFTLNFLADVKVDLKSTDTTTWVNKWSELSTQQAGQTASLSLTGPAATDGYQGPTEMQVWRDNVYGSFMFYPILAPNFTVAATPSTRTITAGTNTTYSVSTAAVDGFTGNIALSATGLPTGVTATFSPATVAAGGSSTMTVTSTGQTASGTYNLYIVGTSGSLAPYTFVTLIVNAGPNFSITAAPSSQGVTAGGSTGYTVSTTALQGFTGNIELTVTGLPSGASATFNPPSITNSGSSTLTVNTSASTPAGGYTLTITGTSGSLVQTTTVALDVVGNSPSFTLSVTPSGEGVNAGGTATYTVSVTPMNGFDAIVDLTVTGLPSASTGNFSPPSITGSGSSTLTVTTSQSTPAGGYTLAITGTSGSLVATQLATITVNN